MTDRLEELRAEIDRVDAEMAKLFEERMHAVREIAALKGKSGKPIRDPGREKEMIARNASRVNDEALRPYYSAFLQSEIAVSRSYQSNLINRSDPGGCLRMELPDGAYNITVRRGSIRDAAELFDLDRAVLIVTDSGVPAEYADGVAAVCAHPVVLRIPEGEGSKNLSVAETLYHALTEHRFTRTDCVVAVGGGVVGDLAGFVASTYMRGIDFYNIPTTLLSQVDSSVGGKVAVDFEGCKNLVGAFYQPKGVLIDPDLLSTLTEEQIAAGYAEIIKMALSCDEELFRDLESGAAADDLSGTIYRALLIKKQVVEADEREAGYRQILNFGHTFGHAVEAVMGRPHGICVAMGMLPMCTPEIRERLIPVLRRYGLPVSFEVPAEKLFDLISHDKKYDGDTLSCVFCEAVGSAVIRRLAKEEWQSLLSKFAKA